MTKKFPAIRKFWKVAAAAAAGTASLCLVGAMAQTQLWKKSGEFCASGAEMVGLHADPQITKIVGPMTCYNAVVAFEMFKVAEPLGRKMTGREQPQRRPNPYDM